MSTLSHWTFGVERDVILGSEFTSCQEKRRKMCVQLSTASLAHLHTYANLGVQLSITTGKAAVHVP